MPLPLEWPFCAEASGEENECGTRLRRAKGRWNTSRHCTLPTLYLASSPSSMLGFTLRCSVTAAMRNGCKHGGWQWGAWEHPTHQAKLQHPEQSQSPSCSTHTPWDPRGVFSSAAAAAARDAKTRSTVGAAGERARGSKTIEPETVLTAQLEKAGTGVAL